MATICAVMSPEKPGFWESVERWEEQRSKSRYPIALELQYKLFHGNRVERTGSGRTLNISSNGVLFETDHPLPARGTVELALKWPLLLDGACGLKLVMRGRIVRSEANGHATAICMESHEFRTTGIRVAHAA